MKMFLAGRWVEKPQQAQVKNPFDGSVIDTVPKGDAADVEAAIDGAVAGAVEMRRTSGYQRYEILHRASELMRAGRRTGTPDQPRGRQDAGRRPRRSVGAVETMELSAEEAKRIAGEVLPLDGASGGAGKLGFTLRVPCGVVVAITPFNFPLNLVCHKLGPALAAGNAVICKPASDTPLSSLRLTEILLEAGLPPLGHRVHHRPWRRDRRGTGERLARVRKVSFTGSRDVGEKLCQMAGLKRVTMELGSNSPLIVMHDADLAKVWRRRSRPAMAMPGRFAFRPSA